MTKNTFFRYMRNIIDDFECFKKSVENYDSKHIERFFCDESEESEYSSNLFLSNTVFFESQLLIDKSAIELYEMYIELITYLTFLKNNISNLALETKIKLTISMLQDDFIPITEKLVRIEVLKLLNIMYHFEELLKNDDIPRLCRNYHLDLRTYNYLLGYDKCKNGYEQISFMLEDNSLNVLDSVAGNRRINYRKKLTSDISCDFLKSDILHSLLPAIKKSIGDNAYFLLEDEIESLIARKKKQSDCEKKDYQYYFTIK